MVIVFLFLFISLSDSLMLFAQKMPALASVVNNGHWIQPSDNYPSVPVWGHLEGIRVGIAPTPGPRGLLRIYTPYLGHREDRMINFIALEPIPPGEEHRGLSELEMSALDKVRGKRFWSSDSPSCTDPQPATSPAKGVIEEIEGVETLTLYIFSETFENGSQPYIRLRFYQNSPYEIELTTYACNGSSAMGHLILTATMGNFARLRRLYLAECEKNSLDLWPEYNETHFTLHDETAVTHMISDKKGGVYFIAAPDEEDPVNVHYASDTGENWKYYGKKATQYWYAPTPDIKMKGLVNGRYSYWASSSPIPGGISFENFELKSPFKNGERFIFGVTPLPARQFIEQLDK